MNNSSPIKESYRYFIFKDTELFSTLYRGKDPMKEETILYLHGGGLVYGNRHDLPTPYIQLITNSGYNLLCIDYPLCPESKLPDILVCLKEAIHWFINNASDTLSLPSVKYILFGRSAGAYLCFLLAKQKEMQQAEGIISLYGYYSLNHPFFLKPSWYYRQYPMVSKEVRDALVYDHPIANASIQERFALYIYCRQQGNWVEEVLGPRNNPLEFELNQEDLKSLPPTFLAASRKDQDVPYEFSVHLNSHAHPAKLYPIDAEIHDFDRDTNSPIGYSVYENWIQWLNSI